MIVGAFWAVTLPHCPPALAAEAADPLGLANGRDVLFVAASPGCSNDRPRAQALNPQTPWCRLGAAVPHLQGGDTVYLRKGLYTDDKTIRFRDRRFARPVTIAGYPDEHPVLGNYDARYLKVPNDRWERDPSGLWVTRVPIETKRHAFVAHADGTLLWVYNRLEHLAVPGARPGVYADAGNDRLYIRLAGDRDPNHTALHLATRHYALLDLERSANITVKDIGIEASTVGVHIKGGDNIVIEGISIDGTARSGIFAVNARRITIRGNKLTSRFDAGWTWRETKGTLQENSAIELIRAGADNEISGNTIQGWFNGIVLQTGEPSQAAETRVHHNILRRIFDDAIEIERYCRASEFHHNLIEGAFVGISLSPTIAKDCAIYRNIVVANDAVAASPRQRWDGSCFKIKDRRGASGLTFAHNTCLGQAIATNAGQTGTQRNNHWMNNLFYSRDQLLIVRSGLRSAGVMYDYNLYYRADGGPMLRYWNSDRVPGPFSSLAATVHQWAPADWDRHSLNVDPRLKGYRPTALSPVIDAGVDLEFDEDFFGNPVTGKPDIGAVEFNGSAAAVHSSQPRRNRDRLNALGPHTMGMMPLHARWTRG